MEIKSKAQQRVDIALEMAEYGNFDGAHHKDWAIDQMVRVLLGCPRKTLILSNGFQDFGENEEYLNWVAEFEKGKDGAHTYFWETGIAP